MRVSPQNFVSKSPEGFGNHKEGIKESNIPENLIQINKRRIFKRHTYPATQVSFTDLFHHGSFVRPVLATTNGEIIQAFSHFIIPLSGRLVIKRFDWFAIIELLVYVKSQRVTTFLDHCSPGQQFKKNLS